MQVCSYHKKLLYIVIVSASLMFPNINQAGLSHYIFRKLWQKSFSPVICVPCSKWSHTCITYSWSYVQEPNFTWHWCCPGWDMLWWQGMLKVYGATVITRPSDVTTVITLYQSQLCCAALVDWLIAYSLTSMKPSKDYYFVGLLCSFLAVNILLNECHCRNGLTLPYKWVSWHFPITSSKSPPSVLLYRRFHSVLLKIFFAAGSWWYKTWIWGKSIQQCLGY